MTATKTRKRLCLQCDARKAKILVIGGTTSGNYEFFCSLACAAHYGLTHAMHTATHCDDHGWHHSEELCGECTTDEEDTYR